MRTPVSFVLGKAQLLVPDAVCLVPRVLCQPYEKRIKGDRTILVGVHPREVEFRFASRNIWQKQPQGRVHSVELRNGMSTRFMERGGQTRTGILRKLSHRSGSCSTVHPCRLDHFLDLFPSSGFGFTLRWGSCIDDPPNCFCASSDRSGSQSIQS